MLIKEVRHIGITVSDLCGAVEFWELLGFYVIDKGKIKGKTAKKITGQETEIEYVKMQSYLVDTNDTVIELVTYTPDIGVKFHIALTVNDIRWFVNGGGYYRDKQGRKIRYVSWGETTIEVVEI